MFNLLQCKMPDGKTWVKIWFDGGAVLFSKRTG